VNSGSTGRDPEESEGILGIKLIITITIIIVVYPQCCRSQGLKAKANSNKAGVASPRCRHWE